MKKLIIQIPCYNEEQSLPITLADLPRELPGIDTVEWLIIDDGSTDATAEIAKTLGVEHIVRHPRNLGLARAFMTGLEACIELGADIIVNTDADNQYNAADIPKLIFPILSGQAQMVIGERPIENIAHFSISKRILERAGSWIVQKASGTNVRDAPSGFRAFSRDAAMQLHVFNAYTYTLETIIQAGHKGIVLSTVPIRTNELLRPSRLIQSIPAYIVRSANTIIRIFMTYQPFVFFITPGVVFVGIGTLIGLRYLYLYITVNAQGHIQSLILAAILISLGGFLMTMGLIADLIAVNRKLLEDLDWRVHRLMQKMNMSEKTPDDRINHP